VIAGGTDNHLLLVDVRSYGLNGSKAQKILDNVNISVNKNTIPFDTLAPHIASGIRIGTPAVTSRGMKEKDMLKIADFIERALSGKRQEILKKEVATFAKQFKLPGAL